MQTGQHITCTALGYPMIYCMSSSSPLGRFEPPRSTCCVPFEVIHNTFRSCHWVLSTTECACAGCKRFWAVARPNLQSGSMGDCSAAFRSPVCRECSLRLESLHAALWRHAWPSWAGSEVSHRILNVMQGLRVDRSPSPVLCCPVVLSMAGMFLYLIKTFHIRLKTVQQ